MPTGLEIAGGDGPFNLTMPFVEAVQIIQAEGHMSLRAIAGELNRRVMLRVRREVARVKPAEPVGANTVTSIAQ